MHYYRVHLSGPETAVEAVAAELTASGARSLASSLTTLFVTLADGGFEAWEELSKRHPRAVLGVEGFELFDDELVQMVIEDGVATEMGRRGVVPEEWGGLYDEDGELLDAALVRAAAERVNADRLRHEMGAVSRGLDVALHIGDALGRLCRPDFSERPTPEAIDRVAELAVRALWISAFQQWSDPAERDFEHALRLTQAVVHASRSELFEQPGSADWPAWLQLLLWAASDVIDAAAHWWPDVEPEARAFGAEYYGTPQEQLESAARSLLTTSLEALTLFAVGTES